MEVQHEWDPGEPEVERGKDEEVRQGVHLDEGEPGPRMRPGHGDRRAREERQVFGRVGGQAGALMALGVEPVECHAVQLALRWIVRPAKPEDLDRPAGSDERFGLSADARILLVIGMGQHADRARHRAARPPDRGPGCAGPLGGPCYARAR